ncbi:MAG: endonuclease/exonuclease/phosphatase family protein [Prevotella sp.]|nr:endonuclease/exonuclease/phosphatase family protein [Prevotella sp.]
MKSFSRPLMLVLALLQVCHMRAGDVVTVCGQNVQNFFYSLDRGRTTGNSVTKSNYNTEEGRSIKMNAITDALSIYEADIYAFNEVECCAESLELLAQSMSLKTGKSYQPVADGLSYDLSVNPDGLIKSGFIYNAAKIEPVGDNLSTAVGYTHIYPAQMRMQTFRSKASGECFTLSMNHFKASTSDDPTYDVAQREYNSIALLKGLDQATLDPDILVMGDLNTGMSELSLNNLVNAGYEEQILKRDPYAASYWYYNDGSLIDHVFANSTMAAQVTDAHIEYVANPHSTGSKYTAYSDHDPYLVMLNLEAQPVPTYSYKKATTCTAGVHYLIVAPIQGLQVANPVGISNSYEYQAGAAVTEANGYITMPDAKKAYIFEDAGNGNYYLKDYYGRYNYQKGTYYSTNVGTKSYVDEANCTFSVTMQGDGTFKILNTATNYYYLASLYNDAPQFTWRNWNNLGANQYLPWLYQYDPDYSPTGISTINANALPTATRKMMSNGQLLIVMPDGKRYTLQGIAVEK